VSTVKTDAITAVSTNGDLSLDGLGTGGVSIASTLKMNKGGDISSASPLVIDTDGNYFDVTGTTNFAAMTVEDGNFFMLQFDGALTITHGSGIELPGAANLTTATGDRLICYATAANTVEVMSVETEAAASGGTKEFSIPFISNAGSASVLYSGAKGDFYIRAVGNGDSVTAIWFVPNDFTSLSECVAVTIPDATETPQFDVATDFGSIGELHTANSDAITDATYSATINQLNEINLAAALTGIAAGDWIGLKLVSNMEVLDAMYVRFKYA